jgi:hypothetical protein
MPLPAFSCTRVRAILLCWACALSSACPEDEDDYDDTRGRGDLGRGRFVYECVNETDSACEGGDPELPTKLAVGGRFEMRFAIESGPQPSVIAPSAAFARRNDGGFQVHGAGDFALLAVNGNREVIDIKHLRGAAIAEVRVQRKSELPTASLRLSPGESLELLAVPFDAQGVKLGGALGYTWSASDEQLLRVESLPALNRVRVRAGERSGTATLQVEVADATHMVSVRIGTGDGEPDAGGAASDGGEQDAAEQADAQTDAGAEEADAQVETAVETLGGES